MFDIHNLEFLTLPPQALPAVGLSGLRLQPFGPMCALPENSLAAPLIHFSTVWTGRPDIGHVTETRDNYSTLYKWPSWGR